MQQQPKYPYSYFSYTVEFYLMVIFSCEYP